MRPSADGGSHGTWLHEQGEAERLVVFGLRAIAFGMVEHPLVSQCFDRLVGQDAGAIMGHLMVLVRLTLLRSRKRLALHAPGCCCLGENEELFLRLVRAAQQPGEGSEMELNTIFEDLTGEPPSEAVLMAAQVFAAELGVAGLWLDRTVDGKEPVASWRAGATLH